MQIKKIEDFDDDSRYESWKIKSLRNNETGDIIFDFDQEMINKSHNIDGKSNTKYDIYEVERTTDGEVFKIGDEIKMKWDNKPFMKIDYFFVSGNQIRVNHKNFGIPFTDDFEKI